MECIICYNNTDLVKLFNCNHQFCLSCLNKIIKKDDNFKYIICPLCRNKTIRTSNLKLILIQEKPINKPFLVHNISRILDCFKVQKT